MSDAIFVTTTLICTYHDIKSGKYFTPFFPKTATDALRTFEQDVQRQSQSPLFLYPQDFTLEILGEYNDTGLLKPYDKPHILATGAEFATPVNKENI